MKTEKTTLIIGFVFSILISVLIYLYFKDVSKFAHSKSLPASIKSIRTLSHRWNDFKYKLLPTLKGPSEVLLISIDDESVTEIGRFPWSREQISEMTVQALSNGAKSIGFDVIFPEPETSNPGADLKFAQVISQNPEKLILGTFSENQYTFEKHQDYCVNEAFRTTIGESLVKLNPSLTIESPENELDTWAWDQLFPAIFRSLQQEETNEILRKNNVQKEEDLPKYQKNYLNNRKRTVLYEYCKKWLTKDDLFLTESMRAQVRPLYKNLAPDKTWTLEQILEKIKKLSVKSSIPQYGDWTANIPIFQEPASYTASFIAELDEDGYVRRYPLFFRTGNRVGLSFVPSMALQSYLIAKNYRAQVLVEQKKDELFVKKVSIYDMESDQLIMNIPVDPQGQMIIKYYGPRFSIPYIPAKEFFYKNEKIKIQEAAIDPATGKSGIKETYVNRMGALKDKSLIVGATAVGLYDLRNTPVEPNYPGPEIHMTALNNLLRKDFLRIWEQESSKLPWIILAIGILATLAWSFSGFFVSFFLFFGFLFLIITVDLILFTKFGLLWHSIFIYLQILSLFFILQLYKYFAEERTKKEIRRTFAKYVAPALVDSLLKDSDNLKLGGRREHMSVFFSDVRGFTTISEKLAPEELSKILNLYLTPMTQLVFKNQGTLDKYMGDAIMAFFGAPVKTPNHAADACRCALESQQKLLEIQKDFLSKGLPNIEIGIGINTGDMSVGNMGSDIVQSYTVMGDSVNLASRLEGITKEYGVRIVISEFTYQEVKDQFVARELDLVKVKGKLKPVRIFELLSEKLNETAAKADEKLTLYQSAYETYAAKDFKQAKSQFEKLLTIWENDSVSKLYIKRCDDFIEEPPPPDWDGVFVMKTK